MSLLNTENLFGTRLFQARTIRGLSVRELGALMEGAVSPAALSKYEKGQMKPSREVRGRICEALAMSEDFFERPIKVILGEVSFRKRSALGVKEERAIREKAGAFFERYAELEDLLGLAPVFENPLRDFVVEKPEDVEEAATRLRAAWGLGLGAIPSVVGLLESKELLIYAARMAEEFDGFAGQAGQRPVIALNTSFPTDRLRFSALHELAHLVLQFAPWLSEREIEKLCHRFAGAMSVSKPAFKLAFGGYRKHVAVSELARLKAIYGLSCAAIMMRAGDLGLVAASTLDRFWSEWSARGYRKNDPGRCEFPERPKRFEILLERAVAEERLSIAKGAELAGRDETDFRNALEILP